MQSERASWRAVIYFNVVRSLQHILATLAAFEDIDDGSDANSAFEFGMVDADDDASVATGSSSRRNGKSTAFTNLPSSSKSSRSISSPVSASSPTSPSKQPSMHQIANLRLRLSPLVSVEEQLGLHLSGGASAGGGEVYVRNGWQSRTIENGGIIKTRRSKRSLGHTDSKKEGPEEDPLLEDVASMLDASKEEIQQLWAHPTVVSLIQKRKLKLDEWSEFFLNDILRIARQDYIPSTGMFSTSILYISLT